MGFQGGLLWVVEMREVQCMMEEAGGEQLQNLERRMMDQDFLLS